MRVREAGKAPERAIVRDARYYELKAEIEEFLFDEAAMLDVCDFRAWLETLAEDIVYFMPMLFNAKFGEHLQRGKTRREKDMSWFNEGKWTLTRRVEQILTGVHWAEEPLSRVCRLVSNVRLTSIAANLNGELEVGADSRFLIYQNRCEHEEYLFVGSRADVVRRIAQGWRLARREINITQNVLLAKNLSIFF